MDTQISQRPIIIVGSTRSGTKLISRIIGGHPDNFLITEHREKHHIPEDKSGICEEFLWMNNFEYSDWRKNGNPCVRVPKYKEEDIEVMRNTLLSASGDQRLIIKNPQNIMRIKFMKSMFPDALYIFCVRNPWHGAQSRLVAGNTNYQLASQKNHELPDDLLLKSIFSWKDSIDLYEQEKNENWHAVRYEDIIFKTKDTVKKVFDFLSIRDDPEYFRKVCAIPRDLKHGYYPMKRAFKKSKYQREIMDLVREGCKVFPYNDSIDSIPGNAIGYHFVQNNILDVKNIKNKIIRFVKITVKNIIQTVFCSIGGRNKLYVSPLVFGALSINGSTLITYDDEKLSEVIAHSNKGERVSFNALQMQYYRLKHYPKVILMDSKGEAKLLLKSIVFLPAKRYDYRLVGEVEYIKSIK